MNPTNNYTRSAEEAHTALGDLLEGTLLEGAHNTENVAVKRRAWVDVVARLHHLSQFLSRRGKEQDIPCPPAPASPPGEGYPAGWLRAVIHLDPATGEAHSDGDHEIRNWLMKTPRDRLVTTHKVELVPESLAPPRYPTTRGPEVHILKTDPAVFDAMASGVKTFEIRKADRDYRVGDVLRLRRTGWSAAEMATGKPLAYSESFDLMMRVAYILSGPIYGLAEGWVIMAVVPVTD
jgi:hypothetical protein